MNGGEGGGGGGGRRRNVGRGREDEEMRNSEGMSERRYIKVRKAKVGGTEDQEGRRDLSQNHKNMDTVSQPTHQSKPGMPEWASSPPRYCRIRTNQRMQ